MASYGTEAGVAALMRRYTNSGVFDTTTNPTYATVTSWLSQVSSMVNVALATSGFATPITDADALPALNGFVESMVADLVASANSAGRFFSDRALEVGMSPIRTINADVKAWVKDNVAGLEAMGATRSTSDTDQIGYRDVDSNGNEVDALFKRENFLPWSINR
jgi:hypothetical protein